MCGCSSPSGSAWQVRWRADSRRSTAPPWRPANRRNSAADRAAKAARRVRPPRRRARLRRDRNAASIGTATPAIHWGCWRSPRRSGDRPRRCPWQVGLDQAGEGKRQGTRRIGVEGTLHARLRKGGLTGTVGRPALDDAQDVPLAEPRVGLRLPPVSLGEMLSASPARSNSRAVARCISVVAPSSRVSSAASATGPSHSAAAPGR